MEKRFSILALITIFSSVALIGCGEKPTHLTSLISGKVVKVSDRSSGNGRLYETTDAKWIADYLHALDAVGLTPERSTELMTGGSTVKFFGEDGKEIGAILFDGPRALWVNGKAYNMDADPDLHNLTLLMADQNEVKQK